MGMCHSYRGQRAWLGSMSHLVTLVKDSTTKIKIRLDLKTSFLRILCLAGFLMNPLQLVGPVTRCACTSCRVTHAEPMQ